VLVTNTVLCLPARKNGKFPVTSRMSANCARWLKRAIVAADATVVVTWGGISLAALKRVEPHTLVLREAVGRLHPMLGRQLLPLYHPGHLARITGPEEQQRADIRCLTERLGDWRAAKGIPSAPIARDLRGQERK
jgi:uracil-DNA glycosylase